jgi:hypothetical protein
MQKLINQFKANPSDANKAKLQQHIRKHPMAICMLMPEDVRFLKTNGFSI